MAFRWTKHCILSVLSAANADNDDGANYNNIVFTMKETKLYISVITLPAKDNKNY